MRLQVRPCIIRPRIFTGWGSEGVKERHRGEKSTELPFFWGENETGADFNTLTSLVTVQRLILHVSCL